jgi:hypothetical protein
MTFRSKVTLLSRTGATAVIAPETDEVSVGLRILAPRPVLVTDIKVGKNSQLAGFGTLILRRTLVSPRLLRQR